MGRWLLPLMFALLLVPGTAQAAKRIALTFDDVPRETGAFFTPDERTRRLIAQLRKVRAPQAAFFVIPGQLEDSFGRGGERRIAAYVRAGNVIGNHTFSHPHLSALKAADYLADVDKAEDWLRGRAGNRPWLRFPYLDEGGTDKAKRDAVRRGLAERHLKNAYVTAEASDWNLEELTRQAVKAGKPIDRKALRRLYIGWHVAAADLADSLMKTAIGRQPVEVMLLHETDLAALYVGDLIDALRRDGWTIVSADRAYADPLGGLALDKSDANGTLTERLAWEKGVPPPLWYKYTDTALATKVFREKVLGETTRQ